MREKQEQWKVTQGDALKQKIEALNANLAQVRANIEAAVKEAKKARAEGEGGGCGDGLVEQPDYLSAIEEQEAAAAQISSDLDAQKQLLYFPETEDWGFRFGSDGVFMGVKHVSIEKIEAEWAVKLGSGSSSGNQIEFKLHPCTVGVTFDGVSIVGEKGSGVPSLKSPRIALSLELRINMMLKYNPVPKSWSASTFKFELADVGRTEGTGLSPVFLQWIINSFVPSRVKKALLANIPGDLGKYLVLARNEESLHSSDDYVLQGSGLLSMIGLPYKVRIFLFA
jgi:hypothetical protein